MDIPLTYCPNIWTDQREYIWYAEAYEILAGEGMIGGKNPYAEFMSEINQIALGFLYADFCQIAFGESGYYNDIVEQCGVDLAEIAFMIGRYTNNPLPENICNDDYEYRVDLIVALAEEQRSKVVAALKRHWDVTEFTVGLYCTAYLPHAFDEPYEDDYSDEANEGIKDIPTETDFHDHYWEYISEHKCELANEIYDCGDGSASAVYSWIDDGCEQVGACG